MTHYGKRIHAFNCPKLKRTILTLDQITVVSLYVTYSLHTYGCLSFFFLIYVAKLSFLLDECIS